MNEKWWHFLKLFDSTFFKMALQFIVIICIGFVVLLAVGFYEVEKQGQIPAPVADPLH